jgi:RimJ/RimL family protein N-acetyltransferase
MILLTWRLRLAPVAFADLPDLITLKTDPRAFAVMLGGVRTPAQAQAELAEDQAFWGRTGVGMWTVRNRHDNAFVGLTGIMDRPDGRGLSLRFAITPDLQGHGLAREAAGAALRDALERAGLPRVIAVTRQENYASRTVLGGIGMRQSGRFIRADHEMLVYQALARQAGVLPSQPVRP